MCEPRVTWGVADDVVGMLMSRTGRRILAALVTVAALWVAAHQKVTMLLLVPVLLTAWAIAATVFAVLFRRRGQDLSAAATATRNELAKVKAAHGIEETVPEPGTLRLTVVPESA